MGIGNSNNYKLSFKAINSNLAVVVSTFGALVTVELLASLAVEKAALSVVADLELLDEQPCTKIEVAAATLEVIINFLREILLIGNS